LAFRLESAQVSTSTGSTSVPRVAWEGQPVKELKIESLMERGHANADGESDEGRTAAVDSFMHELLKDGPVPSAAGIKAAKDQGFSTRQLEGARRRLRVTAKRHGGLGDEGAWWWCPPAAWPATKTTDAPLKTTVVSPTVVLEQPATDTNRNNNGLHYEH